jgi:hypothetical protein
MQGTGYRVEKISQQTAGAIPDFIYRIFGYSYTQSDFYDAEKVRARVAGGSLLGFLCLDSEGIARSLLTLEYSFPSRRVIEIAELLIDPDLSESASGKIMQQLLALLKQEIMSLAEQGLRTAVSLEVTEHQLTQRLSRYMGFFNAGVYLGYIPGWQRKLRATPQDRTDAPAEQRRAFTPAGDNPSRRTPENRGRQTLVVSARPIRTRTPPQELSIPSRFEALIREIYTEFRLTFSTVQATAPVGKGRIASSMDFARGRAIVEVHEVGDDTGDALRERLRHFRSGFVDLVQFVLPLSGYDLDPVVEMLTKEGCSFAAVLPQYRESPVLVMQSINRSVLAPIPNGVFSPRGNRILAELLAVES